MTPHTCHNGRGPGARLEPHGCPRCLELRTDIRVLALLDATPGRVVRMAPRCEPGLDAFDAALDTIRKVLANG